MTHRLSNGAEKIQRFVSDQLKLLETERLAVTMQERQESAELGKEVGVEVVDIEKTSYGGLLLKLRQRQNCKKAPNFKVGENVGLDYRGEDSEPFAGILKESGFFFSNAIFTIFLSESFPQDLRGRCL